MEEGGKGHPVNPSLFWKQNIVNKNVNHYENKNALAILPIQIIILCSVA